MSIKARAVKVLYQLTFPISAVFLHNSERVRVIISHRQEILLQKTFIGSQHWGFPGGGVERGEDPLHAAVREAYEEVGLRITPEELKLVAVDRLPHNRRWPRYAVRFYHVKLSQKKSPTIIRPYEIMSADWFGVGALPADCSDSVYIGLKNVILEEPK